MGVRGYSLRLPRSNKNHDYALAISRLAVKYYNANHPERRDITLAEYVLLLQVKDSGAEQARSMAIKTCIINPPKNGGRT